MNQRLNIRKTFLKNKRGYIPLFFYLQTIDFIIFLSIFSKK